MKSPRRRSVLALLGVSAVAAAAVPVLTIANGAAPLAPDLRADPPENISQPELYQTASGLGAGRLLVRFDGFVTNVGQGPIEIRGNPQVTGRCRPAPAARPRSRARAATRAVAGRGGTPPVYFETADGHNHFHLKNAMRYSLWNQSKTAQVAPGPKVGFCLYDIQQALERAGETTNPDYTDGRHALLRPAATRARRRLRMGTSPGLARRLRQVARVSSGWTSPTPRPGTYLRGQRRRPGQRASGRAAAAPRPTRAPSPAPR